jgi:hypothetical protein
MASPSKHSADGHDGQQPEALRSLKTASHVGGEKPEEQGMTASRSTTPPRQNPKEKDAEATRLLAEGAEGKVPHPKPPAR